MLQEEYFVANIGVSTAKKNPSKVSSNSGGLDGRIRGHGIELRSLTSPCDALNESFIAARDLCVSLHANRGISFSFS